MHLCIAKICLLTHLPKETCKQKVSNSTKSTTQKAQAEAKPTFPFFGGGEA
jgi:hypothetical protein